MERKKWTNKLELMNEVFVSAEKDMWARFCILPVKVGGLSWEIKDRSNNFRIWIGDVPACESPLVNRIKFCGQVEELKDAADAAMDAWMPSGKSFDMTGTDK